MGLETPSVGPQIAECQRILEKSGLTYKVSRVEDQEEADSRLDPRKRRGRTCGYDRTEAFRRTP
jgi:hypothetical protein